MKISPEPLAPLRNWRELWQLEPLPTIREHTAAQIAAWKRPKRAGAGWFGHLFGRTAHR
jgi:hypothetical protein